VLSAKEMAALWHLPSEKCMQPSIVWSTGLLAPLPRSVASLTDGATIGTNVFQGQSQPAIIDYSDRASHVNIIGKTNVGKSTLMYQMASQDIAAGTGVGIIDPHGELADAILATSIPPDREEDVVLFDMTDIDYPVGLNFLERPPGVPLEKVAGQCLSVLRKMFDDIWSASRMEDAIYAALVALLHGEGTTIQDIHRLFHDSGFRAQLLSGVTDPLALEFWYDEFEPSSEAYKREIARAPLNRVRKFYRNKRIRRVVAQRQSLDFRDILDKGRIFIANLGGLSDIEAETLGALLVSKFQTAAMGRGELSSENPTEFFLHIDEVQNFVTTSLPKVFSEARKYGLRLVVANQFLSQLEGKTLEAIMGNVGATIIFRVGAKDAVALAPFVKPQFDVRDLVDLNRFHTVVKMQCGGETQPAFSMQTLPPQTRPADAAERMTRLRELSRRKYARHRNDVDAELLRRYERYQIRPAKHKLADANGDYDYLG
jgi:hypothetical protein